MIYIYYIVLILLNVGIVYVWRNFSYYIRTFVYEPGGIVLTMITTMPIQFVEGLVFIILFIIVPVVFLGFILIKRIDQFIALHALIVYVFFEMGLLLLLMFGYTFPLGTVYL